MAVRRNLSVGAVFSITGVLAAVHAWHLELGSITHPGPGAFPFFISLMLTVIGLWLCMTRSDSVTFNWRSLFWVIVGLVAFGAVLPVLGLAFSTALLVLLASKARTDWKLIELAGALAVIVVITVVIFGVLLRLPV